MKEFEKWWNKVSMEGDWDYEEYAKLGWQEALEWVLNNFDGKTDFLTLGTRVREELGYV